MSNKVNIPRKGNVRVVWNVLPIDYSREKNNDIIELISKKYNIPKKSVKVEPNFIKLDENGKKIELTSDVITNIQDPNFQTKLFEKYINVNEIKDVDFNQIEEIDGLINSKIDYDIYDKFRKYSIKWLKWDNFLSYGPGNEMDFTDFRGLILLNGEPINQSGKTTFAIELIKFLLFGTTTKARTLNEIFNIHRKDETEVFVQGCIVIDGEEFVIQRTLKRPKKRTKASKASQEVKYFRMIGGKFDVNKPLEDYNPNDLKNEGDEVRETNKIIKEAIGKEGDFDLIISATSKNLDDLIDVTDTEKGRLLSRWIGLLPLEEKDKLAREHFNKVVNPTLLSNTYNVETLSSQITELNESIIKSNDLLKTYENDKLKYENNVLKLENEKISLVSQLHKINEDVLKLDITTLNREIERIINKGKSLRVELEEVGKIVEDLSNIKIDEKLLIDNRNKLNKINETLVEYRLNIRNLKLNNESLIKAESCPTCKRIYDDVDNSKIVEENEKNINKMTNEGIELNKEKENIEKIIKDIEANEKLIKERNLAEIKQAKINVELTNTTTMYREKKALLDEYNKNKKDIDVNNEINIKINNVNANLNVEKRNRDSTISYIENERNNIKNYEKEVEKRNETIFKLIEEEKLKRSWKLYLEMVGKNGVSKMVLRDTLPIINGELDRFLNDIADFNVEINITDKNDIVFNLIVDGVVSDLKSASGYERTLSALALRTVLANISTMPKPNFIVLDEILGRVGAVNLEKVKELYDKVTENYQFILHISHIEEIKSWHNQILTVTKQDKISKLLNQ